MFAFRTWHPSISVFCLHYSSWNYVYLQPLSEGSAHLSILHSSDLSILHPLISGLCVLWSQYSATSDLRTLHVLIAGLDIVWSDNSTTQDMTSSDLRTWHPLILDLCILWSQSFAFSYLRTSVLWSQGFASSELRRTRHPLMWDQIL